MDVKALREMHRKEKMHAKLQDVGKDFYTELEATVRELHSKYTELTGKGDISKASILLGELENVRSVVKDMYEARERKIVLNALNYARGGGELETENLTVEERKMLDQIINTLRENRAEFLEQIISEKTAEKPPLKKEKQEKLKTPLLTIRILKDLPPIVGVDGKVYGAFKEEDVATLPEPNAKAFISQGVAEKVDIG